MPVILSITDNGDGTALAVVSLAPGRRAQLIVATTGLDGTAVRANVLALAHRINRKGTP